MNIREMLWIRKDITRGGYLRSVTRRKTDSLRTDKIKRFRSYIAILYKN